MSDTGDRKERERALDTNHSFIVQAPAGSGKTELLIQRYLKLLSCVEYPEQVLSMTFTRKAAADMKKRILEALNSVNEPEPDNEPLSEHELRTQEYARNVLEKDKKLKWKVLENPNRLKILTIDSFCATIIKQMPIRSWVGGPVEIAENPNELYQETAKRLLAKAEADDKVGERVRIILKHLDNSKSAFMEGVFQLLQKRDQWMIPFFDPFSIKNDSQESLEKVFVNLIEAVLLELHNLIPNNLELLPSIASFAGKNLAELKPDCPIAKLAHMDSLPKPSIDDLHLWKGLAELLLTQPGALRKKVDARIGFPRDKVEMKNKFFKIIESLDQSDAFIQNLHEARILPNPFFSDAEWKILKETLLLLPDMAKILRQIFIEQGKTDFTEIALSAREGLGSEDNPTNLLLYLDYKYHHILVDEYQDTSYKQYDLLKRLTAGWTPGDGRTMFIVGDPMQSIYKFRDAEVGLFLKTKEEGVGSVNLQSITLRTNFRSQKKVVDWINGCFESIFPVKNNQDLGAIEYSPSEASLQEEDLPGVVYHASESSSSEVEAVKIADLVSSLPRKNNKGEENKIAILVRARNHLTSIVREFNNRQIEFHAEDIDPLTSRPEIMDLFALMRALTSQTDRVAWLSILRAPWCGLSLEDIHILCSSDKNTPLWKLLQEQNRIEKLSTTGRARLDRIIPILEKSLEFLPTTNFRDLLEGCWISLGGPATCSNVEVFPDIEVFFDKVSDFLQLHDLSQLRLFQENIQELFANSRTEDATPIKIMTMHKAKGLEFDFVILPGLEKASKAEEKRLVYWMPHDDNLLVAPIEEKGGQPSEIYNFLSHFDHKKSDYEILRLLYVAATRTRIQLHLFAQFVSNNNSSPRRASPLNKLWPYIQTEWPNNPVSRRTINKPAMIVKMPKIRRIHENFQLPPVPPNIETGVVPELQNESDTPEFAWAGSGARCLGIVMHSCFQTLAEEGKENWTRERIEILETSISASLKSHGLPPEMIPDEIIRGKTMLRNILSHHKGRWILDSHNGAHCEYSLTQVKNNTYQSRTIDRTFIDENNVRWIIDYKTGQHMGANLETFFENEKGRYCNQLNEYENLFILLGETRPVKKALYYPMHKELLVF